MRSVQLTHYDLDGVACAIFGEKLFQPEKCLQSGYDKIRKYIDNDRLSGYDSLIVTDVSLTVDQFRKLAGEYKNRMLYVDHHQPSLDAMELVNSQGAVCILDTNMSATALMYVNFPSQLKNAARFSMYVDAYDMWRHETHPDLFWIGYRYNILFWQYGFFDFKRRFSRSYDLTESEMRITTNMIKRKKDMVRDANLERIDDKCSIVLGAMSDLINDYSLFLPDQELMFMVMHTGQSYKISVRSNNKFVRLNDVMPHIKKVFDTVTTCGAHPQAGGIEFSTSAELDDVLDVIEAVYIMCKPYLEKKA